MSKSWKRLGKNVGMYGAALAGLAGAQAAQGAVVNLTPTPGTVSFAPGTAGVGSTVTLGVAGLTFVQFNNTYGKGIGVHSTISATVPIGTIVGLRGTAVGNTIFTTQSFPNYFAATVASSGTATLGFHTSSNNVGWIRLNFGGPGGNITYLGAAYESTPGAPIVAGATPEPGSIALFGLGLLALGAVGIRKMRRKAASAS